MLQLPKQPTSRCLCPLVKVTSRHEHLVKNIQREESLCCCCSALKLKKEEEEGESYLLSQGGEMPSEGRRRHEMAPEEKKTQLALKCKSKLWIYPPALLACRRTSPHLHLHARTHYCSTRCFLLRLQILSACRCK